MKNKTFWKKLVLSGVYGLVGIWCGTKAVEHVMLAQEIRNRDKGE